MNVKPCISKVVIATATGKAKDLDGKTNSWPLSHG